MKEQIQQLAKQYAQEFIEIRRHIHAHPELSFQEVETAAFVRKKLDSWGIEYTAQVGGEGVVAIVKGNNPSSRSVALRGDMDALPIEEKTGVEYQSKNIGIMHACGHDVHTTCLLGAAKILNELKDHWNGTLTLVFQPAEEKLPGGASIMLKDGLFSKEKPEKILAQHVFPELPVGKVGITPGAYMASSDELYITVKGKGGHGAKPDHTVDPVLIASHLIIALQQVVSRWSNPITPSVLTIGKVIANGATNVIPSEVTMEGTFRTFDENWRSDAHQRMIALAKGLVEGMGGTVEFRVERGYPVVYNDPEVTAVSRKIAEDYLGKDNVVTLERKATAEDFAYFSQVVPGCFYRLGTASENGDNGFSVHHPQFNIDEKAIELGMGMMAYMAIVE
ncbi:MAG: M20 metallopeptidase family protein [Flavobacteriales bacterium]